MRGTHRSFIYKCIYLGWSPNLATKPMKLPLHMNKYNASGEDISLPRGQGKVPQSQEQPEDHQPFAPRRGEHLLGGSDHAETLGKLEGP